MKTFHVGEIQSEATQDATRVRKSRRFMEAVGGGDFNVGDQRLQTPFLQIARLKAQKRLEEDRVALQNAGQRFSSSDLAKLNEARKGFNYRDDGGAGIDAEIKAILETNGLPETFYEDTLKGMVNSKLFEEDVNAFLNDLIEGEGNLNSPGEVANRLGYFGDEVSRIALQTSPDDVGLGSLYQTDRITNIAVKQALEQAINSGADFITFNRSDLVQGMTGGDLKGHQEYYDKILPKNVNKLMERLEKEHKVKLPRLEDLKIRSSGPALGKVKGFALTPELKELFKGTGISAYREGGQVKLRSGVMALPGNGVVR